MPYLDYDGVVTLTEEIKSHSDQTYEPIGSVETHNQSNSAHTDIRQSIPTKVSQLQNDSGYITDAGVTSFNGATGDVTYTAPVQSVNGQTGAVSLNIPDATSDLLNDSGFITAAAIPSNVSAFSNDAGYLTDSTLPDYKLTYDAISSVDLAEVDEAETDEPNYTPTGTVSYTVGSIPITASAELAWTYSSYALVFSGVTVNVSAPGQFVTGITGFEGTDVKFAIEEEE